jgi:protein gp37
MSTKIEWADETVNPFAGCSKLSTGCTNCYALKMAHRLSYNPDPRISDKYQGTTENIAGKIQWVGKINNNLQCMEKLFDGTHGKKVFVGSMGDIAHPNVTFDLFTRILDKCYSINNHRIHNSDVKKRPTPSFF